MVAQPPDGSVPLAHYVEHHPDAGVRFTCEACQHSLDVPVGAVVDRLKARGLGDERTGIREIARFSERPCPKCGAMRWSTRPAFSLPPKGA